MGFLTKEWEWRWERRKPSLLEALCHARDISCSPNQWGVVALCLAGKKDDFKVRLPAFLRDVEKEAGLADGALGKGVLFPIGQIGEIYCVVITPNKP
ncbi:MAG: hypothetical protein NZ951_03285 [Dehalococcoidia bacterium]|nr:hypothetical protein [Dehalococcoidia bacterium]